MFGLVNQCVACGILLSKQKFLCISCFQNIDWVWSKLPSLSTQLQYEFPIQSIWIGGMFTQYSPIQFALKAFKYRGRRDIAQSLGNLMGQKCSLPVEDVCLVPVPLSRKKLFSRGYNQALELSKGIHSVTGIPIIELLERGNNQQSLTTFGRLSRSTFQFAYQLNPFFLHEHLPKQIILVDDVITTGGTILQCCKALTELPNWEQHQVSIICLAYADDT